MLEKRWRGSKRGGESDPKVNLIWGKLKGRGSTRTRFERGWQYNKAMGKRAAKVQQSETRERQRGETIR